MGVNHGKGLKLPVPPKKPLAVDLHAIKARRNTQTITDAQKRRQGVVKSKSTKTTVSDAQKKGQIFTWGTHGANAKQWKGWDGSPVHRVSKSKTWPIKQWKK